MGASFQPGGDLALGNANLLDRDGVPLPQDISISPAAGGSNVCLVTFNVLDGRGQNVRTPTAFALFLSDSSIGSGLTRDRGQRRRGGRVVHQPGRRLRGRQELPGGSRQDRPAVAGRRRARQFRTHTIRQGGHRVAGPTRPGAARRSTASPIPAAGRTAHCGL